MRTWVDFIESKMQQFKTRQQRAINSNLFATKSKHSVSTFQTLTYPLTINSNSNQPLTPSSAETNPFDSMADGIQTLMGVQVPAEHCTSESSVPASPVTPTLPFVRKPLPVDQSSSGGSTCPVIPVRSDSLRPHR